MCMKVVNRVENRGAEGLRRWDEFTDEKKWDERRNESRIPIVNHTQSTQTCRRFTGIDGLRLCPFQ